MGLKPGLLIVVGVALAGCGYKAPVTRLLPPDPALSKDEQREAIAEERKRVEAGLALPADARPVRVDDLTVKLEVRPDDLFSLPPEGTANARTLPFPGDPLPAPAPPARLTSPKPAPPADPQPVPER